MQNTYKKAFTLAEVLITLAIIGIVAALTLPQLLSKYKKMLFVNQFKKTYSSIQQAWLKTEADLGYTPQCYYAYTNADTNEPALQDDEQLESDCPAFMSQLKKNLRVIKTCEGNAVMGGCIPQYEGIDTVMKTNFPSLNDTDIQTATLNCNLWRKNELNNRTAWVLQDGQIIMFYKNPRLFAVDINGKKKPNRWGFDIYGFKTVSKAKVNLLIKPTDNNSCSIVEYGGLSTQGIIQQTLK